MTTATTHNLLLDAIMREIDEINATLAVVPEAPSPDQMLDTPHLAALIQVSPRTVENWRSTGKGPPVTQIGTRVRYRYRDVLNWIAHQNP